MEKSEDFEIITESAGRIIFVATCQSPFASVMLDIDCNEANALLTPCEARLIAGALIRFADLADSRDDNQGRPTYNHNGAPPDRHG